MSYPLSPQLRGDLEHCSHTDAAYLGGSVEVAGGISDQTCPRPSPIRPAGEAVEGLEFPCRTPLEHGSATIPTRALAAAALRCCAVQVTRRITNYPCPWVPPARSARKGMQHGKVSSRIQLENCPPSRRRRSLA